jgi:transcriptional regulator with XRE-family HTH domain
MDTAYDPTWLKREMAAHDIATGKLAKASGVSRSQIQRIKLGMAPRMDTLVALRGGIAALTAPQPVRAA